MRRFFPLFTTVIAVLLLTACAQTDRFEGGRPISREDLESMSAALFETESPTESEPHSPSVVYWTEGGSVYHRDPHCSHLAKADKVSSGYVGNAIMYGKDRPCSLCGEK